MARAVSLPQPPYKQPLTGQDGSLTMPWSMWFQQLYARVGGPNALTNVDLNATMPSAAIAIAVSVGNTNTTIYTSPTGESTVIDSFSAHNISGGTVKLSVYVVPVGDSPASKYLVLSNQSIVAGATLKVPLANTTLGSGATVIAIATVNAAIQITINGRNVS